MAAVDIKLDQNTRDIVIVDGLLQLVEGIQAGAQRINMKLHTFLGEWFLDLLYGVPYQTDIKVKDPQMDVIAGILKAEILDSADEGSEIKEFDLVFDDSTRVLNLEKSTVLFPGETEPTDISTPLGV